MSFPAFTAVVRDHPGGVVVKLRGAVGGASADDLAMLLRRVVRNGALSLVIDCRLAEFGGAKDLESIIETFEALRREGGDLVVRDPSTETRQLLESAGLKKSLRIIES